MVGRGSGRVRLGVLRTAGPAELGRFVARWARRGCRVYTDEWAGYGRLPARGRVRAAVSHAGPRRTWARDLDGDGVREAHTNTCEGRWVGLRNFLRPFRGVNKIYLEQYIKMFEWSHNIKRVTDVFLRLLLGGRTAVPRRKPTTRSGT